MQNFPNIDLTDFFITYVIYFAVVAIMFKLLDWIDPPDNDNDDDE